jgi:hypothetical protein
VYLRFSENVGESLDTTRKPRKIPTDRKTKGKPGPTPDCDNRSWRAMAGERTLMPASWNHIARWLEQIDALQEAA